MNRAEISVLIRNARLLHLTDFLRFQALRIKNLGANRDFKKKNPDVRIPPDYMLYESFAIDYPAYYYGGRTSAADIHAHLSRHRHGVILKILDWGCGPARIIRHMPGLFPEGCEFYGCDYNPRSIRWCSENIPGVAFSRNDLAPPLPYDSGMFDMAYGISIFTHLSQEMHRAWIRELHRVLNREGILLLTTAGNAFRPKLTRSELSRFDNGELIVRSKVREGHRTFTAFHPAGFMQDLFSGFRVLEHIEPEPAEKYVPQDIWIAKKS